MNSDLLRTRVVDGQIRCPRCQGLLCKVYYGEGDLVMEFKCRHCRRLVLCKIPSKRNKSRYLTQ